jgi:hypothetical protein
MPSPGAADAGELGPEKTREIAKTAANDRPTNLNMRFSLVANLGLSLVLQGNPRWREWHSF